MSSVVTASGCGSRRCPTRPAVPRCPGLIAVIASPPAPPDEYGSRPRYRRNREIACYRKPIICQDVMCCGGEIGSPHARRGSPSSHRTVVRGTVGGCFARREVRRCQGIAPPGIGRRGPRERRRRRKAVAERVTSTAAGRLVEHVETGIAFLCCAAGRGRLGPAAAPGAPGSDPRAAGTVRLIGSNRGKKSCLLPALRIVWVRGRRWGRLEENRARSIKLGR
jgi:hypothetical protein